MLDNKKKVNVDDVKIENSTILDVFCYYTYLDDEEIIKRSLGICFIDRNVKENILKLKKNIFLNRDNFKSIKYNNKTVGFIQLVYDNYDEIRIGIVIGKKKLWGIGIGTIAIKKMVKFIFENYNNIKKISLDTAIFNIPAKKCFQKAGFILYNQDSNKYYFYLTKQDYLQMKENYL